MSSNHWNHDVAFSLALSTAVDTEFGKSCTVEAACFTWSIAVYTGFSSANTEWIDKTRTKESNKATTAIFAISNSFHRNTKGLRLEHQERERKESKFDVFIKIVTHKINSILRLKYCVVRLYNDTWAKNGHIYIHSCCS